MERVIKRSDYDSDNVNNDIALLRLAQVLVFITLATITRLSYFIVKIYKKIFSVKESARWQIIAPILG